MPYASILARHGGGSHGNLSRDSTGLSEDLDEFVDARETPGPPSPTSARGRKGAVSTVSGKTMEELQLENDSLRSLVDELSHRLWRFEISSQMSTAGLHQSIRTSMRQNSSASNDTTGGDAKDTDAKLQVLEKEMQGLKRENEKLKGVVARYRERWEKLKEGAKMRREGTDQGKGKGDPDG